MVNPAIAATALRQTSQEVMKETGKTAIETFKEVGKQLGDELREITQGEKIDELAKQVIKEVCDDIAAEVLADLDPELQAVASVIMQHYAKEGVEKWTGLELKNDGDLLIHGEKADGSIFQSEYIESPETLIEKDISEIEGTGEKVIILSDDFYDLPSDDMDSIREKVDAANNVSMEVMR